MVIVYSLKEVHLATLETEETCPYCKHRNVTLDIGQLYVDVIFGLCMPSRRTGRAYCNHCNCEIPKKQWSPYLKDFFNKNKKQYKLSKWKRYSFLCAFMFPLALGLLYLVIIIILAMAGFKSDKKKEVITPKINQAEALLQLTTPNIISAEMYDGNALGIGKKTYFMAWRIQGDTIWTVPSKDPITASDMESYSKRHAFNYQRLIPFSHRVMNCNGELYLLDEQYRGKERLVGRVYKVVRN